MANWAPRSDLDLATLHLVQAKLVQRLAAQTVREDSSWVETKVVEFVSGAKQAVDKLIEEAVGAGSLQSVPPVGDLDETTVMAAESAIARYQKSLSLKERVMTKLGARAVETIFTKMHHRLLEEQRRRENKAAEGDFRTKLDVVRAQVAAGDVELVTTTKGPRLRVIRGGLAEPEVGSDTGLEI